MSTLTGTRTRRRCPACTRWTTRKISTMSAVVDGQITSVPDERCNVCVKRRHYPEVGCKPPERPTRHRRNVGVTDPATSAAAANLDRSPLRYDVLAAVVEAGQGTRGSVATRLRETGRPEVERGSVSKRLQELTETGLLELTDRIEDGGQGAANRVYVPTDAGRKAVRS